MLSDKLGELLKLKASKARVKAALMNVQIRGVSVQYDYLEHYAMRIQIQEVQKHAEKLSSKLNYPTINNLSLEFIKLAEVEEESVPIRIFSLNAVTLIKEYAEEKYLSLLTYN